MSSGRRSIGGTLIAGILVVAPVYLGILLLLKALKSLAGFAAAFRSIASRLVTR